MHLSRRRLLLLAAAGAAAQFRHSRADAAEVRFHSVEAQSRQFMRWHAEIRLSPAQEAVKKAALGSIPAPCCSDNSAYTCCCTCNISRTIWGLSQYMIARQGASAEQVRAKVREWIAFINPKGFSGSACYRGGCPRPFSEGGCGGMDGGNLVL